MSQNSLTRRAVGGDVLTLSNYKTRPLLSTQIVRFESSMQMYS